MATKAIKTPKFFQRSWFKALVLSLPWMVALGFSGQHVIKGMIATFSLSLPPVSSQIVTEDPSLIKNIRREVQAHFRRFNLYVPPENIVLNTKEAGSNRLNLLRRTCGKGDVFIWIPLRVDLPYVGLRSYEWCFASKLKTS